MVAGRSERRTTLKKCSKGLSAALQDVATVYSSVKRQVSSDTVQKSEVTFTGAFSLGELSVMYETKSVPYVAYSIKVLR